MSVADSARNGFNKAIVSIYKLIGFVVLTGIMFGITMYLVSSVFYLVDRGWVVPLVLSPSSEKVLQMNSHLINQNYQREALQVERMSLEAQLESIDRTIEVSEQMLSRYKTAVWVNLEARRAEREALLGLYQEYAEARPKVEESTEALAALTERNIDQELEAGLISEESYIRGRAALSSNLTSWVGYAQKEVDFETTMAALDREIEALRAASAEMEQGSVVGDASAMSIDVLTMMREYNRTRLDLADLEAQRLPIEAQITAIDNSMESYAQILDTIRNSPYYYALNEDVTVAFVPYENLKNVEEGTPIYGCAMELLWCKEVGQVEAILEGEVVTRHPLFKTDLRGLMVHIELEEDEWAEEKALYAESKPLFI